MFKTETELLQKTTDNIRQGKIIYQPELLSALYYVDYIDFNATGSTNTLPDSRLMGLMTPICQIPMLNSQKVMWIEKHRFAPAQRPSTAFHEQTDYLLNFEAGFNVEPIYSLLLDNQLLAKIKAPYRSVLIDATCDIAQNYNEIIGLKNTAQEINLKMNDLISQCLLLIDVNTGAILSGFPGLALLKYPSPKKQQRKKNVKKPQAIQPQYDVANGQLKSNCISVTLKELQQITKLLAIGKDSFNHISYLMIGSKLHETLENQDKVLVGTYRKGIPNDAAKQILETNLVKYLRNIIKWHLTKKGHMRFNLLTPLPDWQKEINKYQFDNLYLLTDMFQDHTRMANPGKVFPKNNYNEQTEILGDVFNDHFLEDNLRQKTDLYQTFKFPKKAALTAAKIALQLPKNQLKTMQPLMPAKGVNNLITAVKDQNSPVYYYQKHLFALHATDENAKKTEILVKETKL